MQWACKWREERKADEDFMKNRLEEGMDEC